MARATDPNGWNVYTRSQFEKLGGIGDGLNAAKDATKAGAVDAWKALTDGKAAEFLAQPDAINKPLFTTTHRVLDALANDPYVVNRAAGSLGNIISHASESYTAATPREQGRVIGEVMFGMVNPEGSLEAPLLVDRVATRVDAQVMEHVQQTRHRRVWRRRLLSQIGMMFAQPVLDK